MSRLGPIGSTENTLTRPHPVTATVSTTVRPPRPLSAVRETTVGDDVAQRVVDDLLCALLAIPCRWDRKRVGFVIVPLGLHSFTLRCA